jgi:hypothetical protein
MTELTGPKLNRVKYAAMVLGAAAIAAVPSVGLAAVATAEPPRSWDIEDYDNCLEDFAWMIMDTSINEQKAIDEYCCVHSGGIFIDDGYLGKCVAPPAEPAKGSRQLPGNIQIPSDIATAPTVTKDPPRPIQVPSDIATVSTVSLGNEVVS